MGQQPCLGTPFSDKFAPWRGLHNGPVTDKKSGHGHSATLGLFWGFSCMQGWRDRMEDAHLAIPRLSGWRDTAVFGVLDGHGGEQVARFCEVHLPEELARQPAEDLGSALAQSFQNMDQLLLDPRSLPELRSLTQPPASPLEASLIHPDYIGCTALVCCVRPEAITVANAGDCRAVLCRGGKAIDLSEDHKPNLPGELARIQRAGGCILEQRCPRGSVYRVNGDLSLSRALGDLRYKQNSSLRPQDQLISSAPDVRTFRRQPNDEFLVLACDGVWDVLSSQQAVDFVRARLGNLLDGSLRPEAVTESLLDACLSPDLAQTGGLGGDNMTLLVVAFAGEPAARQRTASYDSFSDMPGLPFPRPFDVLGGCSGLPQPCSGLGARWPSSGAPAEKSSDPLGAPLCVR